MKLTDLLKGKQVLVMTDMKVPVKLIIESVEEKATQNLWSQLLERMTGGQPLGIGLPMKLNSPMVHIKVITVLMKLS